MNAHIWGNSAKKEELTALMSVLTDLPEDELIRSKPIPSELIIYDRQRPFFLSPGFSKETNKKGKDEL